MQQQRSNEHVSFINRLETITKGKKDRLIMSRSLISLLLLNYYYNYNYHYHYTILLFKPVAPCHRCHCHHRRPRRHRHLRRHPPRRRRALAAVAALLGVLPLQVIRPTEPRALD
jgi:hypothetical protein